MFCDNGRVNPFTLEEFPIDKENHLALHRVKSRSVSGTYGSERVKELLSRFMLEEMRDYPQKKEISVVMFLTGLHALPPEKVAELKAKIAAEREQLQQKTDMAEEERDKAAAELEKREKDVKDSE